ncbi:MAG: hypothetical protein US50_C0021G0008 [Candidatus Nomurabacteria bacterium GW2011_GWB1_37_5]|uniref:Uncharacterized protein n=1 Tax=Candidatus Nomurabacteria bacterium GW2011_GWB1_37_5 TaxID=1618742 RepID=A0A0G0JEM0_9BACT|nr:MAG: hypothetical protein US50_C0021G0008 [Candidatus Nomurabacteria bacterium GW2011_GWB1_37_5]
MKKGKKTCKIHAKRSLKSKIAKKRKIVTMTDKQMFELEQSINADMERRLAGSPEDGGIIEVMDKLYGPGPEPDDYFEGEISNELNLNDLRQESKSFTRESSVKSKESVRGASEFRVGPLKR